MDMDLCCSESSVDSLEDVSTPTACANFTSIQEWTCMDTHDASDEATRLLLTEEQALPYQERGLADEILSEELREYCINFMCPAAMHLRLSFETTSLAVNLFDRHLASSRVEADWQIYMIMACLTISAKLEESSYITILRDVTQYLNANYCPGVQVRDMNRMELAVLSAIGWRAQGVTAAHILDPLICLLDIPVLDHPSKIKQLFILRESCRLIIAKTFREKVYRKFRASSLATAAIYIALEKLSASGLECLAQAHNLARLFSEEHSMEIRVCQQLLRQGAGAGDIYPKLSGCSLEVMDSRIQVVVKSQGPLSPTSVLRQTHYRF